MSKFSLEDKCKYKEIFNNQNIPMLIIDPKTGDIDDANFAACKYYSYSKEKLLSMNLADINILDKQLILNELREAKIRGNKSIRHRHRLSNNEIREVEIYSSFIEINNKDLVAAIIHDYSVKIEYENNYIKNKIYFDNLFNNSPEAIAIVDNDFKILNINGNFTNVFQYEFQEILNEDITRILCGSDLRDISYNFRETIIQGQFVRQEVTRQRKDGIRINVLFLGLPLIIDNKTVGAYCVYTDITEKKRQEDKIEMLTYNDFITGLFNREFFMENLKNELSRKKNNVNNRQKLAVLALKVNEYKEINEALGSLVGDSVLKEFAQRLRDSLEVESIIARFINDQFVVMLANLKSVEDINILTSRIIENFKDSFYIDMNELKITTSIGIAIYPDDGMEAISLIRKAEIAMVESSKSSEKALVFFKNAFDYEIQEYFWIKRDLSKALNNKEFFLEYQPIYNTNKNELVGVEALIRWSHKDKGIIPPLKFIPVAEKTGMIHSIGEWIMLEACTQNSMWQMLGYKPINISINVSVLQFEKPGFSSMVKRVLKDSMLDPKQLQLEITETYFTRDYKLIKETIKELSNLGVKFAIDDFGTGYSSLGQLSELNINTLKIDRIFVDGVNENPHKAKIVKAIISLAHSLGISLTAEGVEKEEELIFLKENNCTTVQGFLFSKPVGVSAIENLLKKETTHKG